jgi:hypothetical protein
MRMSESKRRAQRNDNTQSSQRAEARRAGRGVVTDAAFDRQAAKPPVD